MRAWLVALFVLLVATIVGVSLLRRDRPATGLPAEPPVELTLRPPELREVDTWADTFALDDATLEGLTLDELWALGVRIFDWIETPPPGTTKARAIERFQQDRAWHNAGILDLLDPLGYFSPPPERTGATPGSR